MHSHKCINVCSPDNKNSYLYFPWSRENTANDKRCKMCVRDLPSRGISLYLCFMVVPKSARRTPPSMSTSKLDGCKQQDTVLSKELAYFGTKYETIRRFELSTTDLGHTSRWAIYATNKQSSDYVTKSCSVSGPNQRSSGENTLSNL